MKTIFIITVILIGTYMFWYASKVDKMVEQNQTCTDQWGAHYIAPEC